MVCFKCNSLIIYILESKKTWTITSSTFSGYRQTPNCFERVMCPRYTQASIFTLAVFFYLAISENKNEKRTLFLYVVLFFYLSIGISVFRVTPYNKYTRLCGMPHLVKSFRGNVSTVLPENGLISNNRPQRYKIFLIILDCKRVIPISPNKKAA